MPYLNKKSVDIFINELMAVFESKQERVEDECEYLVDFMDRLKYNDPGEDNLKDSSLYFILESYYELLRPLYNSRSGVNIRNDELQELFE